MKRNLWQMSCAAIIVAMAGSTPIWAQTSASSAGLPGAVNTSVASNTIETQKKLSLPLSVGFTSMFYGPAVTDPTNSSTAAYTIGDRWGLSVQNQIAMKYKLSSDTAITPVFDFFYQLTDPNAGGAEKRVSLAYDSYIKLSRSGIASANIRGNDFALDGDLRLFVPTSESSRENNTRGGIRLSLNPSIQFGKSSWSMSSVNHMRFWVQTQDKSAAGSSLPRMQFYTGPQLNYKFSDAVTAWALYEATVIFDTAGIPNTTNPKRSLADLEPGVDIKIHDRLSLTPYLNWYTNQPLSTASVNLTANITML